MPVFSPIEPTEPLALKPQVAAIVPAYNESGRVCDVLETLSTAQSVDEVICVTDGCTDDTAEQVKRWIDARDPAARVPVRLFALTQNIGKGGAMAHGAHNTFAEVLLFLDADLIGLRPSQVDDMLAPMLREKDPADMTLGLFGAVRGGLLGWWLSWCHRMTPSITGQRAIRREVFLSVPGLTRSRFGVEAAITSYVQSDPSLRLDYAYLHSVTHPIKEEKLGPLKGFRNRMRMYRDIAKTLLAAKARREAAEQREKMLLRRQKAAAWLDKWDLK